MHAAVFYSLFIKELFLLNIQVVYPSLHSKLGLEFSKIIQSILFVTVFIDSWPSRTKRGPKSLPRREEGCKLLALHEAAGLLAILYNTAPTDPTEINPLTCISSRVTTHLLVGMPF